MRWDDGEFDFEILPEVVDEDIGLTVSIENIIMEGASARGVGAHQEEGPVDGHHLPDGNCAGRGDV